MKTLKPFFSIVIPTLNEEKYLPRLLEDLSAQTFTDFEVIHVDGSSEDETINSAKKFQSQLDITIKSIPHRNVSKQRNLGANLASGQWIVFMDADNRIGSTFLSILSIKTRHHKCDVFTCYMDNMNIPMADRPIITLFNIWLKISYQIKPFSPGALIGLKKTAQPLLSFNETLHLSEDFDYIQQALRKQLRFIIFDQPRYICSLRRLKKEGSIKMARVSAQAQINFFLNGKQTTSPLKNYPMYGGQYYNNVPQVSISKIQQLIETSPRAQLLKIKTLIKKFQNI